MTNQQLKAHCEDVIANPQDHLDWVVDMAKEALTALTQPASPALKLPDPFSPHDAKMFCTAHGVTGAYELASKMANYAVDKVVRLNAPHTAPIEPICATGGAEWVKPVPRELQQVLLELRTYNPKADEHGGKHIIPGWADRIEKALGIKPVAPEEG